jgi:hypothetical protein
VSPFDWEGRGWGSWLVVGRRVGRVGVFSLAVVVGAVLRV